MCDIVLTSWAIYQEKFYMLVSFHISMTETSKVNVLISLIILDIEELGRSHCQGETQ